MTTHEEPERTTPPTLIDFIGDNAPEPVRVFDPALRHYPYAFRWSATSRTEPTDLFERLQSRNCHRVLGSLASTRFGARLMLRGSWHLHLLFGDAARRPNDLDFVLLSDGSAPAMSPDTTIREIVGELTKDPSLRAWGIHAADAAIGDIWTYERIEGRRAVLPWESDGRNGLVQIDLTFDEEMPIAPDSLDIGDGNVIPVASLEMSLAWKLLWLRTDGHPQVKDLFDAELLARHTQLTPHIVDWIEQHHGVDPDIPAVGTRDWEHFSAEYPELADRNSPADLRATLLRHLR